VKTAIRRDKKNAEPDERSRKGAASQTFPAELGDFRRICVENRKIRLQMKF
jgi:hypothetical protein